MFGNLIYKQTRSLWLALVLLTIDAQAWGRINSESVEPQTLEKTLQGLMESSSQRMSYQETRSLKSLNTPLISSGYLEFHPPDTLIKTVEKPLASTYLLSSQEIRVTDGNTGESHSLGPDAIPELAYVGSSLTSLLTGDKAQLLARWTVSLGGTNHHWQMSLIPLEKDVSGLRMVRIEGQEGHLKKLHIEALDGSISDLSLGIQ